MDNFKFRRLGSVFRQTIHDKFFRHRLEDGYLSSKPHVEGKPFPLGRNSSIFHQYLQSLRRTLSHVTTFTVTRPKVPYHSVFLAQDSSA